MVFVMSNGGSASARPGKTKALPRDLGNHRSSSFKQFEMNVIENNSQIELAALEMRKVTYYKRCG